MGSGAYPLKIFQIEIGISAAFSEAKPACYVSIFSADGALLGWFGELPAAKALRCYALRYYGPMTLRC